MSLYVQVRDESTSKLFCHLFDKNRGLTKTNTCIVRPLFSALRFPKIFLEYLFSSGYPLPLHFWLFLWMFYFGFCLFRRSILHFPFDWSLSVLLSVCIFLFNFFLYPFFILEAFFFYTFLADGFAPLFSLFLFLPFSLSLLLFLKILGTSDTCRIPSLIIWLINLYHLFILTSWQFRIALVTFDDFWKSWKHLEIKQCEHVVETQRHRFHS